MTDKIVHLDKKEEQRSARLEALTAHLTESLEPQKPIMSVNKRALVWLFFSFAYIALVVSSIVPLRHGVSHTLIHTALSFDSVIAVLMGGAASYAAIRLMVPVSRDDIKKIVFLPLLLVLVFVSWTTFRTVGDAMDTGMGSLFKFHACFWQGFIFIAVPAAAFTFFSKRGASTTPYWLHSMALISIFAFGWICLRLTCGIDHAAHAFLFHFLPFVSVGLLSGFFTRQLFKTI